MRSIARKLYYRYVGEPPPPENPKLRLNDRIIHTGKRSYAEVIDLRGQTLVKKTFTTSRIGKPCFAMEKRANTLFAHYPWMTTWLGHGRNWFLMPRYPEDAKLANLAKNLPKERRQELAGEALSIALDIFVEGYAHRDFHAGNLFLIDDGLKLVDFEWMTPYPDGWKGTFWQSHDVTGECLERFKPDYAMGFTMDSPHAISNVLGVTLDEAKEQLGEILKKELHEASTTFKTHKRDRHVCSAGLTYSAFSLPHLTVDARSAQRNCSRRFEQFGVGEAELGGKTLLDLGSNIGGMLFEAQKFKPSQCLGVEVDSDKVAVARRVAAFAELVNLSFMQADIDRLS